jgi:hypothetical protein
MSKETCCKGHTRHLCELHRGQLPKTNPDAYAELVKDPKYVCKNCGRVAAGQDNLCAPVMLGTWEE